MKIGVFGGTFDPFHEGHFFVAREVGRALELDRVLLMVARRPPHKDGKTIVTESYHRYAMAVLGSMREDRVLVSALELEREGPSYTVDTMRALRRRFGRELCFIAGSDSLREIHLWRECGKLFEENCLVFVNRPGANVQLSCFSVAAEIEKSIRPLKTGDGVALAPGAAYLLELDPPPISSTDIRFLLASGREPSAGLLNPEVYGYIRKYGLYGEKEDSKEDLRGH